MSSIVKSSLHIGMISHSFAIYTINTFRKRVKNAVTSKGIQVGIECK
jgi:hypothetical protein